MSRPEDVTAERLTSSSHLIDHTRTVPSNARVKQIMQMCNVRRQARVSYKGDEGVLMIVRDSSWTSVVQGGMAAADAIRGATDYAVEKAKDVPEYIAKKFSSSSNTKFGATYGGSDKNKLIFIPDDESREYLVFESSLSPRNSRKVFEEIESEG